MWRRVSVTLRVVDIRCWIIPFCLQVASCTAALAQIPGQPAPPDISASATVRAEQFLKAIALMSPAPAGTDADRAQAWPRSPWRVTTSFSGDEKVRTPRTTDVEVKGDVDSSDPAYGPHWDLSFYSGEIEVSVDPGCAIVGRFVDGALSNALSRDPAPAWSSCLAQDQATQRALTYLRLAGVDAAGLDLSSAIISDSTLPACGSGRIWQLRWRRVWNSVVYEDQDVTISLDAGFGRLIALFARIAAAIPADSQINVSSLSGAKSAAMLLAGQGLTVAGPPTVVLRIVLPTDRWSSANGRINTRSPNSRLAWVMRIPVTNPKDELDLSRYVEVWIDCANGAVLGGDIAGSRGSGAARALSGPVDCILRTLGCAPSVQVSGVGMRGPDRKIGPGRSPVHYYGALSQLLPVDAKSPDFRETHVLTVLASGKSTNLKYDAASGIIRDEAGNAAKAGTGLRGLLERSGSAQPTPRKQEGHIKAVSR